MQHIFWSAFNFFLIIARIARLFFSCGKRRDLLRLRPLKTDTIASREMSQLT